MSRHWQSSTIGRDAVSRRGVSWERMSKNGAPEGALTWPLYNRVFYFPVFELYQFSQDILSPGFVVRLQPLLHCYPACCVLYKVFLFQHFTHNPSLHPHHTLLHTSTLQRRVPCVILFLSLFLCLLWSGLMGKDSWQQAGYHSNKIPPSPTGLLSNR